MASIPRCEDRHRPALSPKRLSKKLITASLLSAAAVASAVASPNPIQGAHGWASMQFQLPNGQHVYRNGQHWPAIGHEMYNYKNSMATAGGGSQLNAFGKMMKVEGMHWTQITCNADADGDGYTNGEELGDPDCVWTRGAVPSRTTDISHPGYKDSVPTTFKSRSQLAAEALQREFSETEAAVRRAKQGEAKRLRAALRKRQQVTGDDSEEEEDAIDMSLFEEGEEEEESLGDARADLQSSNDIENEKDEKETKEDEDKNDDSESATEASPAVASAAASHISAPKDPYEAEQFKFLENEYIESRLRAIERDHRRRNGERMDPEDVILAREEEALQRRIAEFHVAQSRRRLDDNEQQMERGVKERENDGVLPDSIVEPPVYDGPAMPSADAIESILAAVDDDEDEKESAKGSSASLSHTTTVPLRGRKGSAAGGAKSQRRGSARKGQRKNRRGSKSASRGGRKRRSPLSKSLKKKKEDSDESDL